MKAVELVGYNFQVTWKNFSYSKKKPRGFGDVRSLNIQKKFTLEGDSPLGAFLHQLEK